MLSQLTAEIVAAYLSRNPVRETELPPLISSVYQALSLVKNNGHGNGVAVDDPETPPRPAVSITKSVRPDSITCLECGKTFSVLRRHLNASHHMTPQGYRARWNLPISYPMTAPAYTKVRSELAKEFKLGEFGRKTRGRPKLRG